MCFPGEGARERAEKYCMERRIHDYIALDGRYSLSTGFENAYIIRKWERVLNKVNRNALQGES
ncbi:MAG TPA: hypothetical protein VHR86_10380, partial [Armatimonadota bacterium]|nr:hypothetical protein [Armatimonadota bacterium]